MARDREPAIGRERSRFESRRDACRKMHAVEPEPLGHLPVAIEQQARRHAARRSHVRQQRPLRSHRMANRADAAGSAEYRPRTARSMPSSRSRDFEGSSDGVIDSDPGACSAVRIGTSAGGIGKRASSARSTQRSACSSRACTSPAYALDDPRVEHDAFFGIGPRHRDQRFGRMDFDADFFGELAAQCVERRFAGVALAAREFPEAGKVFAGWALGDEHASVRIAHDAGDDVDGCVRCHRERSRLSPLLQRHAV